MRRPLPSVSAWIWAGILDFDLFAGLEGVCSRRARGSARTVAPSLQKRVQIGALDLDDNRLVALVADDGSLHYAAGHRFKPSSSVIFREHRFGARDHAANIAHARGLL